MALILSCCGKPIPHDFPNHGADLLHLGKREPIASREVAWGASGRYVAFQVREGVVDAIQAPWRVGSPAMNARLPDQRKHLCNGHVAGVDALVSLPEKAGAPFLAAVVLVLARHCFGALLWSVIRPSVRAVVPAGFPRPMARLALISKTERPAFVPQEIVCRRQEHAFASVALARLFRVERIHMHYPILTDGPHFELSRAEYPA
jgi:hypothetical protein